LGIIGTLGSGVMAGSRRWLRPRTGRRRRRYGKEFERHKGGVGWESKASVGRRGIALVTLAAMPRRRKPTA